jgi:hypothetical protein
LLSLEHLKSQVSQKKFWHLFGIFALGFISNILIEKMPKLFSQKIIKNYAHKIFNVQKITQTFMMSMHNF